MCKLIAAAALAVEYCMKNWWKIPTLCLDERFSIRHRPCAGVRVLTQNIYSVTTVRSSAAFWEGYNYCLGIVFPVRLNKNFMNAFRNTHHSRQAQWVVNETSAQDSREQSSSMSAIHHIHVTSGKTIYNSLACLLSRKLTPKLTELAFRLYQYHDWY